MNKVTSFKGQRLELAMSVRFISQDEAKKMSKYRVIQKNLVHIQGFPDSIADNLEQYDYMGQFGRIVKLVIVKGKEDETQLQLKKSNSAYITYSSNEEAAYAVLAVDSFNYDNHLIRAFFGTSKYCIHFLNNKECYNKDKCMYLHSLASEEDVLGNTCGIYSKYDYSEHLQIALMISGILSKEKKEAILRVKYPKTIFPNIKCIYAKDFVMLAERMSSSSFYLANQNNSKGSTRTSSAEYNYMEPEPPLFHYRTQSRFFNEARRDGYSALMVPSYVLELVDKLSSRYSFFKQFSQTNDENELKMQQEYLFNDSWSEFNIANNKIANDK